MRVLWITLPLSGLIAAAGFTLMKSGSNVHYSDKPLQLLETRHPVTPEMEAAAASLKRTPLPNFSEVDLDGEKVTPADFRTGKPSVLIFVKNECPCSVEAQPFFNAMAKAFGGNAQFFSVFDGEKRDGEAFVEYGVVPYRMILDTDFSLIQQFKMTASASLALIDGDGQVVQVWPGYSQDILRQLNMLLGTLSKVGPQEFEHSDAPKELTAGCAFEIPNSKA